MGCAMARFPFLDDGNKPPQPQAQLVLAETLYQETVRRVAQLPRHRTRKRLLGLLVELERLTELELTPTQRFALLRPVKSLALEVASQLPKSRHSEATTASGRTLEQRLLQLMAANLKRLMRDLDRPRYLRQPQWDEQRHWAQANLMAFLGRQISYSASTGRPVPAGTWQELHDLFVYLVLRTGLRPRQPGAARAHGQNHRLELAYKRLLLVGVSLATEPTLEFNRAFEQSVTGWSLDTWLIEPDQLLGRDGLILVEIARDAPPRWEPATLTDPFRGWVLAPPNAFLAYLAPVRGPTDFAAAIGNCDSMAA